MENNFPSVLYSELLAETPFSLGPLGNGWGYLRWLKVLRCNSRLYWVRLIYLLNLKTKLYSPEASHWLLFQAISRTQCVPGCGPVFHSEPVHFQPVSWPSVEREMLKSSLKAHNTKAAALGSGTQEGLAHHLQRQRESSVVKGLCRYLCWVACCSWRVVGASFNSLFWHQNY